MVLANVRNPAEQHHLLRVIATAAERLTDTAATAGGDSEEGRGILALASDLEAGRQTGEPWP